MYTTLNFQDDISEIRADILLNTSSKSVQYGSWLYQRLPTKRCSSIVWRATNEEADYLLKTKFRRPEKTLIEYSALSEVYEMFKDNNAVTTPRPVGILGTECNQTIVMTYFENVKLPSCIYSRRYRANFMEALTEAYTVMTHNRFFWSDARLGHVLINKNSREVCLIDFENSHRVPTIEAARSRWEKIKAGLWRVGLVELWFKLIIKKLDRV